MAVLPLALTEKTGSDAVYPHRRRNHGSIWKITIVAAIINAAAFTFAPALKCCRSGA